MDRAAGSRRWTALPIIVDVRDRLVPPLFASTDPEPEIYRSVQEFENYAEAIDVENGEWRGYDAAGTQMAMTVERNTVRVLPGIGSTPETLAGWLRSSVFLKSRRDATWLARASLEELVAAFGLEDR